MYYQQAQKQLNRDARSNKCIKSEFPSAAFDGKTICEDGPMMFYFHKRDNLLLRTMDFYNDEWDLIAYLMNNIELKALQLTFVNPDKVGVVIYTNFSRYLDIRISTLWDI